MAKIYDESGYVNWQYLYNKTQAFCMVVGARGVGKTYGAMKYLITHGIKFMYVRRLQTQLDMCASASGNPFKKVSSDLGQTIQPRKRRGIVQYNYYNLGEKQPPTVCCVGVALSTFATIRGVDYSDIDCILFDEAIAQIGEHPIKDEFNAFLNLYETVNRNRELENKQPVKAFLLGNANRLANPYFSGWGFMKTALRMLRGKQMLYETQDHSRIMVLLQDSPISEAKKNTALYKNGSTSFSDMALANAFDTDPTQIKSMPLQEYKHIVSVGEIGCYSHKSTGDLYISEVVQKQPYFKATGIQLEMWRKKFQLLLYFYYAGKITFQNYDVELIFRSLLKPD